MIKRMANAWKDLQERMRSNTASEYLKNISSSGQVRFPSEVAIPITLMTTLISLF